MGMKVLFYDPCCPKPYDSNTLLTEGLGGSEATVIRIADGLKKEGYDVTVEQHNRKEVSGIYAPEGSMDAMDHVICLRIVEPLFELKKRFPNARFYLWLHDLAQPELALAYPFLAEIGCTILTVSEFHRTQVIEYLRGRGALCTAPVAPVKRIYNPVDADLTPNRTYDANKLVFFSSPHKGLGQTIELFEAALKFNRHFKLYIANPGYLPSVELDHESLVNLGTLTHSQVLMHVRDALCVFYINTVFPETFGLVLAEANSVGTPVLTHSLGAAPETLDHPSQLTDCHNPEAVIRKLMKWHDGGRPTVRGKSEFRLQKVIKEWIRLLRPIASNTL